MIIDLNENVFFRGFAFEVFAEKYLRKFKKNSFIFRTNKFRDFDALIDYYKIDVNKITNVKSVREYFKSIDIIEFKISDYKTKIVDSIEVYEVKSKIFNRKIAPDISIKSHNRYLHLKSEGFLCTVVMIVMFENWRFSINLHDFESFKFSLRKSRFLFTHKAKRLNSNIAVA